MKNFIGLKIKKISTTVYNEITIELNDGSVYSANLSKFNDVYCYPKNMQSWLTARIGEYKADIEWDSGFAVHIDQIAALATDQKTA
jgi:cell division septal protein FtsQ